MTLNDAIKTAWSNTKNRIAGIRNSSNLTNPEKWLVDLFGGRKSKSGVVVNEKTALQVSTVIACIRLLATQMATLPFPVYKKSKTGREKQENHRVTFLLNKEPNPRQTAYQFWFVMFLNYFATGDAYAEIEWENDLITPKYLWPIPSGNVIKKQNTNTGEIYIELQGASVRSAEAVNPTLYPESYIHLDWMSMNGTSSFIPFELAREIIGLSIAAEQYASEYFTGANQGAIVELPNTKNDGALKLFRDSFRDRYAGLGKADRVIFLENGAKFTKLASVPNEGQMIEARKFQVEEICRFFGVPPMKVMSYDKATYSNFEEASMGWVQDGIVPHVVQAQQETTKKLFKPSEKRSGHYVEANLDALLRGRQKDRYDAYVLGIQNGILSPNEARAKENLADIGEQGDQFFIQQNMWTLEQAMNGQKPQTNNA